MMNGGFCPDEWHGTTETDLQDRSFGEDWHYWNDVRQSGTHLGSWGAGVKETTYAEHDAAISLAAKRGQVFHLLPIAEQDALLTEVETATKDDLTEQGEK